MLVKYSYEVQVQQLGFFGEHSSLMIVPIDRCIRPEVDIQAGNGLGLSSQSSPISKSLVDP